MIKIFIFSTQLGSVDIKEFKNWLGGLDENCLIRTSGSRGLDSFVDYAKCNKEIYIPWQNFNDYRTLSGDDNTIIRCPTVTDESMRILDSSLLGELKEKFRKIDNRLVYGILGKNLKDPVDIVIINNVCSKELPTTSSALVERIAINEDIPTINLSYKSIDELMKITSDKIKIK